MSIEDLIDELAAAEQQFAGSRFIAPVMPGGKVRVRIAGIVCDLVVEGEEEPGFALLEAIDSDRARVVGRAKRRQIAEYLKLFVQVRLVLADQAKNSAQCAESRDDSRSESHARRVREDNAWLALPAQGGTQRLQLEGIVPVQLVQGAGRFDTVLCRFDGQQFWFEGRDKRRDRAIADYLRKCFVEEKEAEQLAKKKLSPQEREAYRFACQREQERQALTEEGRLQAALQHAGGKLQTFIDEGDRYRVSWTVDGERYTSAIGKGDLTVMVAGICLAGQDRRFDLSSLVGVMRERGAGGAPRVGAGGMDVEQYFDIHPEEDE